jgi:hypothetical protein
MATSEFTAFADLHEDCIYTPLDHSFDINTLRIEEGLVINAYGDGKIDFPGKYAIDDFFPTERTAP